MREEAESVSDDLERDAEKPIADLGRSTLMPQKAKKWYHTHDRRATKAKIVDH